MDRETKIDIRNTISQLSNPSICYWKIEKKRKIGSGWIKADDIPMTPNQDIEQEIIGMSESWGGSGTYKLTVYNHEDEIVKDIEPIVITIKEETSENRGGNAGENDWQSLIDNFEQPEETEAQRKIREEEERIALLRKKMEKAELQKEIDGLDGNRGIEEIRKAIEGKDKDIFTLLIGLQQQNMQAISEIGKGKQNDTLEFIKALSPILAPIAGELIKPKESEMVAFLKSPLASKLIESLMHKEEKRSPLEEALPGLMNSMGQTMNQITTQVAQQILGQVKSEEKSRSDDKTIQKIQAVQGLWSTIFPSLADLAGTFFQYKYGTKQENKAPEKTQDANAQPSQEQLPVANQYQQKIMGLLQDIQNRIDGGDDTSKVFSYLMANYEDEFLKAVSAEPRIEEIVKTAGGKFLELFEKMRQFYGHQN